MAIRTYIVANLAEYYETIATIARIDGARAGTPLWFRGHPYAYYNLLPSIMRTDDSRDRINNNKTYGTKKLREDYRIQNYKARVFHLIQSKPYMKLEWQALYQHNLGKTRLMDWSESARTALSFALEAFINPRELKDLEYHRCNITPTIWVLNPRRLNENVYSFFSDQSVNNQAIKSIEKALMSMELDGKAQDFLDELQNKQCYFTIDEGGRSNIEIDGIMNLGVIDEFRENSGVALKKMLEQYEFNPFFYLCLRYYSDALPFWVEDICNILPPLAILHQYQSERIRAQRGVFTIFPNYNLSPGVQRMKNIGYDCRMLENQKNIENCLYKIRILNPNEVAKEILYSGERQTELYPENEYYVHTLEADKFFV